MRLCLVGPGVMPIPPNGWGAVEALIWDYYTILKKHGVEVDIINIPSRAEIVERVNAGSYDVVHIHYDVFVDIIGHLNAPVKIISSHYPYINNSAYHTGDNYHTLLPQITNNENFHIFASSQKDIDTFVEHGAVVGNTFLSRLGIKNDDYSFYDEATYDKTLCFSQIIERKRQYLIQNIDGIDFMGRLSDPKFNNASSYKGEVPRDFLNREISKYSNFILISSVENTTPLAVKEALICGLGVVVSESVAYELDEKLEFVSVIKERDIGNIDYIKEVVVNNKKIATKRRGEIREYGVETFGLEAILVDSYISKIEGLLL